MRDKNSGARAALVVPGALLVFYATFAILYAGAIRSKSDFCSDGSLILVSGVCYTVWKLALPILMLAIVLIVVGLVRFRAQPTKIEDHLKAGTGSHVTLSILISLVVIPLIVLLVQIVRENRYDTQFVIDAYGVPFRHVFLLALTTIIAAVVLVPFLGLWISHMVRARTMLSAATALLSDDEQPESIDEDLFVDDEGDEWPNGREDDRCQAITQAGEPCKLKAMPAGNHCSVHHRQLAN